MTVATGLLTLLSAFWVLKLQGHLWRRAVWRAVGGEIQGWADASEGVVAPLWLGWRVRWAQGEVRWRGGIWGHRTVVRAGKIKLRRDGLLSRQAIDALVRPPTR
ncbi:MAG: hypothetical protein JXX28_00930 [Deltaproteobacteria bacterium]|nr:hypothetical protein [Deltaproteobacteria bacterium]